ncbi:hypothetical protein MIB92_17830 [Aestuariirhabdus sp. Z084]|uniref:hypothetical protein n=1 Tax=Aestuariirhabdus haliotis TaxID=2918751 RepID=UPI00201B4547|nr:hypothetical protein [Aestuariirhabdus haliotis]MCL6417525.1 hypothetical protein [Aestuariirhabdus haliotis]MCL6421463.1 hypothetical protein [Aestuariirhabdus haliotis]
MKSDVLYSFRFYVSWRIHFSAFFLIVICSVILSNMNIGLGSFFSDVVPVYREIELLKDDFEKFYKLNYLVFSLVFWLPCVCLLPLFVFVESMIKGKIWGFYISWLYFIGTGFFVLVFLFAGFLMMFCFIPKGGGYFSFDQSYISIYSFIYYLCFYCISFFNSMFLVSISDKYKLLRMAK